MKLTKTKLKQLIREALAETKMDFSWGTNPPPDTSTPSGQADYEDWERRTRGHEAFVAMGEEEEEGKDLFASLSKEEKDLAEEMLYWWSQQIKKGRESTLTGKDPEPFFRMWQDWDTIDLGVGDEEDLKLVRDALINWPFWGERGDRLVPETKALASKIEAILSGDIPEEEEEQTPQEIEQDRWRKALREPGDVSKERDPEPSSRFANLEFDEALQRYREGQVMKLTRSKLRQLIHEELERKIANMLDEKAKSKAQQRFMGMVHKCQETGDCASEEVRKAAASMKKKDTEDFASTKHKDLPEKVDDE